jgi:hypothetical protein
MLVLNFIYLTDIFKKRKITSLFFYFFDRLRQARTHFSNPFPTHTNPMGDHTKNGLEHFQKRKNGKIFAKDKKRERISKSSSIFGKIRERSRDFMINFKKRNCFQKINHKNKENVIVFSEKNTKKNQKKKKRKKKALTSIPTEFGNLIALTYF